MHKANPCKVVGDRRLTPLLHVPKLFEEHIAEAVDKWPTWIPPLLPTMVAKSSKFPTQFEFMHEGIIIQSVYCDNTMNQAGPFAMTNYRDQNKCLLCVGAIRRVAENVEIVKEEKQVFV